MSAFSGMNLIGGKHARIIIYLSWIKMFKHVFKSVIGVGSFVLFIFIFKSEEMFLG